MKWSGPWDMPCCIHTIIAQTIYRGYARAMFHHIVPSIVQLLRQFEVSVLSYSNLFMSVSTIKDTRASQSSSHNQTIYGMQCSSYSSIICLIVMLQQFSVSSVRVSTCPNNIHDFLNNFYHSSLLAAHRMSIKGCSFSLASRLQVLRS